MGYCWNNLASMIETGMRQVTCMIRQRQLRLFRHVASLSGSDPVSRVISEEISPAWRRPRGQPAVTWLQRTDGQCRELGLIGRVYAWQSSRGDTQCWRRTVAARCSSGLFFRISIRDIKKAPISRTHYKIKQLIFSVYSTVVKMTHI